MATITAAMVKDLREKTGAGMMDCKKALSEADGDMEAAIDNLRKAGIAKQEKKAGRATTEGRIAACIDGNAGALVEVLCETDFVSGNDVFSSFCDSLAARVAAMDATGDLVAQVQEAEKAALSDLVLNVGENVQIRRAIRWQPEGEASSYIHGAGKIGVLVDVAGATTDDFGRKLAMHIAAASPSYVSSDDVPPEAIAKEKEIAAALPDLANKPENIKEKILEGKIRKWFEDVCLVKQTWVHDSDKSVEKADPGAKIVRFARWQVGEEL